MALCESISNRSNGGFLRSRTQKVFTTDLSHAADHLSKQEGGKGGGARNTRDRPQRPLCPTCRADRSSTRCSCVYCHGWRRWEASPSKITVIESAVARLVHKADRSQCWVVCDRGEWNASVRSAPLTRRGPASPTELRCGECRLGQTAIHVCITHTCRANTAEIIAEAVAREVGPAGRQHRTGNVAHWTRAVWEGDTRSSRTRLTQRAS